ncbi:hypothetical protein [Pyxidicoccus xibeiensis]|uniref:hypothetical protein n=1 Tax=Pyxidicoccus xibeiensis TaxID=2906759 RepID=UPI0020A71BF6|nr:hypothetical protein [Pyxidicoccus xibeiensis]MCP3141546.1 hypothetical protein [Pyxidicoccus xibeiensis]
MKKVFQRIARSTRGVRRTVAVGTVLATMGVAGIATAQRTTTTRQFTETDVQQILSELRGVDPSTYHLRLPTFYFGRIVGTKTYGTLPITQVRLVATRLNVQLNETGNVLTVFDSLNNGDESGGGGGGGGGGGPGSHINSASAGTDLSSRISVLLQEIDTNQFQYLR